MTSLFTRVGCDVVEISRIQDKMSRKGGRFIDRLFTEREQELAKGRAESFAAYFAAKEAFAKALGSGIMSDEALGFLDLEVQKDENGRPYLTWQDSVDELLEKRGQLLSHDISLSHDGGIAMAICVLLFSKEGGRQWLDLAEGE